MATIIAFARGASHRLSRPADRTSGHSLDQGLKDLSRSQVRSSSRRPNCMNGSRRLPPFRVAFHGLADCLRTMILLIDSCARSALRADSGLVVGLTGGSGEWPTAEVRPRLVSLQCPSAGMGAPPASGLSRLRSSSASFRQHHRKPQVQTTGAGSRRARCRPASCRRPRF
jgi:hypothetical protein